MGGCIRERCVHLFTILRISTAAIARMRDINKLAAAGREFTVVLGNRVLIAGRNAGGIGVADRATLVFIELAAQTSRKPDMNAQDDTLQNVTALRFRFGWNFCGAQLGAVRKVRMLIEADLVRRSVTATGANRICRSFSRRKKPPRQR